MALYEDLKRVDVMLGPVHELLSGQGMIVKGGKIVWETVSEIRADEPWLYTFLCPDRECGLWTFYFEKYRIIPRGCFNCWKVVARPRTLKELFELRLVQKKMSIPAKCGVDGRPEAKFRGHYAGFFYGPYKEGFRGARKLYRAVRDAVSDGISPEVPVVLKRACTEMEDAAGPTHEWKYPEWQHGLENLLDEVIEFKKSLREQPWFSKVHILVKWIEYAREHRDPTAEEFVDDMFDSFGATRTSTYHGELPEIRQREVIRDGDAKRPEFQRLSKYL